MSADAGATREILQTLDQRIGAGFVVGDYPHTQNI
jgi:hypothetical protein